MRVRVVGECAMRVPTDQHVRTLNRITGDQQDEKAGASFKESALGPRCILYTLDIGEARVEECR